MKGKSSNAADAAKTSRKDMLAVAVVVVEYSTLRGSGKRRKGEKNGRRKGEKNEKKREKSGRRRGRAENG